MSVIFPNYHEDLAPVDASSLDEAPADLADSGSAFLSATDDLYQECLQRVLRGKTIPKLAAFEERCAQGKESELLHPNSRWQRVYQQASHWRLGEVLRQQVHRNAAHEEPFLDAIVRLRERDDAVEMAPGSQEKFALSDAYAYEAAGRALCCALVSPAVPKDQRVSAAQSMPRFVGALWQGLWWNRLFLKKAFALSKQDSENLAFLQLAYGLYVLRQCAMLTEDMDDRPEAYLQERVNRLLRMDVSVEEVKTMQSYAAGRGAVFRAQHAALCFAQKLRESFDEDWFNNPRLGEWFASSALRGGCLSIEQFMQEQDVKADTGILWLTELSR
ncbi:MAG: hypothetical protein IPJ88_13550 [Myxococcales bacterium]|nr:MAG: hypothetical protein IPJ88_13550 [Myxococcales bacterium]